MTARIARGGGTATRRAPARASSGAKRKGKAKPAGLLDHLPISPKTLRKLGTWAFVLALIVVAIATAFAFKLPQKIGTAIGEQVGAAGFAVSRVELRGLNRLNAAEVTKTALDQPSQAMPLIDLDEIRERLIARYRWIREVRVHRRLPDTLVVEIEERVPAAIWQRDRERQLIDSAGVVLPALSGDALPNLPTVAGAGAQHRLGELNALLDGAPEMREHFAGATWISGRRWDVRFKSGETLMLPEGEQEAGDALRRFAEMNGRRGLLGSNFLRFDMRIGGKMIVQLRQAPDGRVPATAPGPAASEPPQDLSRTI